VSISAYIEDIPYIRDQEVSTPTGDYHYDLPLRPKLTFKSRDGEDTYYTFDGFINNNDINVVYCDADNAVGETGVTNILIEDSARDIDTSLINKGKKVVVQIAKTQAEYQEDWSYFLVAYIRGYREHRPRTGQLLHEIRAYGTKVIFAEREVNMKKQTENVKSSHLLKNLIKSLINDKASYPFGKPTLKNQIVGLSNAGVSDDLVQFVPTINFELIQATSAMDRLTDIAGGRWFIDHTGGEEILNVSFPTSIHSGVTIKSGDIANKITDDSRSTSYFYGPWDADSDTSSFSGYANRLITKTQIDRKSIASNFTNHGAMDLSNKALAVKAEIFETRLSDMGLILSKVGEPESPNSRVNARIIADNGNKPTGAVIADFKIDLASIPDTADTVFINELDIRTKNIASGSKVWVVLYQRSGTSGDPNNDTANTIRWHHDNNLTEVTPNVSMQAVGGDRDMNLNWTYIVGPDKGPTFNFGIFSKIRHIQEVSDRAAINEYGLIEAQVDTSFLEDASSINFYLASLLQYTARPRIVFNVNAVSCPDKFLFKPYQNVTIQDTLAYPQGIEAEIQRARYVFSAEPGTQFAQGAKFVEITPMGFEDFLSNRFKCA
jgi:hypothetical protein